MTELGEIVAVVLAAAPEKPAKSLRVRFDKTAARCGNEVVVLAHARDIPDGTTIKFELKTTGKDVAVASLSGPLSASQAHHPWVAKKPDDDWADSTVGVIASGGGVSARGENQLEIRKYHRTPLETKTINCVSGAFGWTGRFDIELRDNAVHITIKIRLINRLGSKPAGGGPLPAAGPPLTNAAKRAMATDIESKLSHKNLLHRERCRRHDACDCPKSRGCCKLRLFVHVVFVEVGEHHTVDLFRGPGRANATNWTRKKTRGNSWAHETGHLLGWYDEYPGGAVGPAPRWKPNRTTAVMNVGLEVPNEYNWDFRDWLKDKVGEPWRVLKE